ncbi:MAG: hypothetical protein D6808_01040 [Candidatus Dadabacteria bacterium]|nr:MAG: hypothetical protein D6808_01040 [Candidatus Dadabacteria bacterium]
MAVSIIIVMITIARLCDIAFRKATPPMLLPCRAFESLNSEGILALGQKIPLSKADLYDLELISGISDTIGRALLRDKLKIISKARELPPGQKYKALTIVKGIGEKKAKKFYNYLTFKSTPYLPNRCLSRN